MGKKKNTFNKIQQLFMTKALRKLTTKGNFLKLLKNIYKNVIAYTILSDKMNAFPIRLEKKERMSAFITSFQHGTGSFS